MQFSFQKIHIGWILIKSYHFPDFAISPRSHGTKFYATEYLNVTYGSCTISKSFLTGLPVQNLSKLKEKSPFLVGYLYVLGGLFFRHESHY